MGKSLAEMTAEIREVNIALGWQPAEGGPGDRTFGDFIALLHSEVSEALEAYRKHLLADATTTTVHATRPHGRPKPQGVGSELADVLIRLLNVCDAFGIVLFDTDLELADVAPTDAVATQHLISFGDWCTNLHKVISQFGDTTTQRTRERLVPHVLRRIVAMAEAHGIDLTAEYERKIAFNRTREFRHGGRHL